MHQLEHTEHLTINDALDYSCADGYCEHDVDDFGESTCPPLIVEVCVDCMDEEGAGRDPGEWDDRPLRSWPHPEPVDSGSSE